MYYSAINYRNRTARLCLMSPNLELLILATTRHLITARTPIDAENLWKRKAYVNQCSQLSTIDGVVGCLPRPSDRVDPA